MGATRVSPEPEKSPTPDHRRQASTPAGGPLARLQRAIGNRAVVRVLAQRQILDPEMEDDVIDIEIEKRRNRLQEAPGKIARDDPRRAMLEQNRQQKAELGPNAYNFLRADRPSSTTGGTVALDSFAQGRDQYRESVTTTLAEEGTKNVEKAALAQAESKATTLAKKLNPSIKAVQARKDPLVEEAVVAFKGKDWVVAAAKLEALDLRITEAKERAALKKASVFPRYELWEEQGYYKPPDMAGLMSACEDALSKGDWIGAPQALADLENRLDLIDQLQARLDRIKEAAKDPEFNDQHRKNLDHKLNLHKAFTWEQVVNTLKNDSVEGSLAELEYRVKRYGENTGHVKKREEAIALAKSEQRWLERDGVEIDKVKVTALKGVGEVAAVQAALTAWDNGTVPVLTHPNGMKWGENWGNRDGDLPPGTYKEYYVQKAAADPTYHGSRRLVIRGTRIFYTWTHYGDNGRPKFVYLDRS